VKLELVSSCLLLCASDVSLPWYLIPLCYWDLLFTGTCIH